MSAHPACQADERPNTDPQDMPTRFLIIALESDLLNDKKGDYFHVRRRSTYVNGTSSAEHAEKRVNRETRNDFALRNYRVRKLLAGCKIENEAFIRKILLDMYEGCCRILNIIVAQYWEQFQKT